LSAETTASVVVRYFAAAAEAASREEETLAVAVRPRAGMTPGDSGIVAATVGDLRALLLERYGEAMARVLASGSFLVDGVVSRDDARTLGARVDVLPPFAGG
jgi:molybdopterin synthase sulfur carrier subunit